MANTQEGRYTDLSGKTLFDSNNPQQTDGGPASYSFQSVNESGQRYLENFFSNGIARKTCEGRIQVECGDKNKDGQPDFVLIAHNGDVYVNADSGSVTVGARAIHFKASEEIILDAPSIRIGSNEGQTNKIEFHAQNFIPVENGVKKKFELKEALISSSAIAAFKGSLAAGNLKLTA
tara:strand:- start:1084 stop:1614 length:531 start_codon:yes stop_codon:yes gene_type:complete